MNVETVAANLRNTIAGKELYLANCEIELAGPTSHDYRVTLWATIKFLEVNIGELKHILADVEQCAPKQHVGDSQFEDWFQAQPFATQSGTKQMCRDSYAAGMGDGK
jgi:hypothetical protein